MRVTTVFRFLVSLCAGLLVFSPGPAFAQSICASDELRRESLKANPELQKTVDALEELIAKRLHAGTPRQRVQANSTSATDVIVPVVVYVIHQGGPENIPDQQVVNQLAALNAAFSGHGIRFCLATREGISALPGNTTPGIIHIGSPLTNHVYSQEALLKATSPLPADRYLRIWVVRDIDNHSGVVGYARFPGTVTPALDGIVMRYDVFGNAQAPCAGCSPLLPNYDQGKILAHEVGHYLNLFHTFQGGCSGIFAGDCAAAGDMVCDTPQIAVANTSCPSGTVTSCDGSAALLSNEMDYTNDLCRTAFTQGQEARMLATLATARQTLGTPQNLVYTGVQCAGGNGAYFAADNYNPCTGQAVTFEPLMVQGATYSWNFGDGATASGTPVTHSYAVPGTYSVALTVTAGSNSSAISQAVTATACAPIASSQGNWYFGTNAALSFSTGTPVALLNNGIAGDEACVTQSDAAGNLLFYSDSRSVFGKNHTQMPPGITLSGDNSASNGAISVPDPGNPKRYYLIYSANDNALRYTIVDFSNNAFPTGTLVAIDTTISGAPFGEQITAVPKCNGIDYWVVAHQLPQTFLVYSLTSAGISPAGSFPVALSGDIGILKASPDGTMLAQTSQSGTPALYNFDRATGAITLRSQLPHGNCGVSFSPDSRLLYLAGSLSVPNGVIYQYDLTAANPALTSLLVADDINALYGFVALQLGPDKKIYASNGGYDHLEVINFPNSRNTPANPNACGYNFNGPSLLGRTTRTGLPNMIDALTPQAIPLDFSYSFGNCGTVQFTAPSCASYAWSFGDSTTSTAQNPLHVYPYTGTFTVTLMLNGSTAVTHAVTVGIPQSTATIFGPATACPTGGAQLLNYSVNGQPGLSYNWTVTGGAISGPVTNANVDVIWGTLPGSVHVAITDANGCAVTNDLIVTQNCSGTHCVTPPAGLVGWWPFDEACGVMAQDIGGLVNNFGTLMHGPVPVPGIVGNALSFDGIDDYVQVSDHAELNFTGGCILDFAEAITIDAWVKTSIPPITSSISGVLTLIDKRVNPNQPNGYHLFLYNGRLGFQNNGANFIAPFTGPNSIDVADGQWHFIAVSLSMCRGGGGILYVDGKVVLTFPPGSGFVNTADLYIGARDPAFGGSFFPGAIDELEIYKNALSSDELRAIFEARGYGKCKADCSKTTITMSPGPYQLTWTNGALTNPTLNAAGGTAPYTFTVTSGSLPPGVTLSSNGLLLGTSMTLERATFPIAVTAVDANGCRATRNYAVVVSGRRRAAAK
jgi:PKD repeat protein